MLSQPEVPHAGTRFAASATMRPMSLAWVILSLSACEGAYLGRQTALASPEPATRPNGIAGMPGASGAGGGGAAPATVSPDVCAGKNEPGHTLLRRLTNTEYTNTVQALLFTTRNAGSAFQESARGPSGYSNDALGLPIFPALVRGYYDMAVLLAKEVIASKGVAGGAWSRLVPCDLQQATCAQASVGNLARRALRRPLANDELPTLMSVYQGGGTAEQGLHDVIVSLLMHPAFLMIPVVDRLSLDPTATFELDDHEFASRLSYF
jgi:hypothetical protein